MIDVFPWMDQTQKPDWIVDNPNGGYHCTEPRRPPKIGLARNPWGLLSLTDLANPTIWDDPKFGGQYRELTAAEQSAIALGLPANRLTWDPAS